MSHSLGVYFAPEHHRQQDRDYIAALQPPVVRILDPDVQQIADVHALAPNAIVAPRTWVIDDHDGAAVRNLMADPVATGRDHAQQYRGQWDRWTQEAAQRGLRLPPVERVLFSSANEPNQGGTPDKIAAYTIAFLDRCTELGIRACGPCLGVGWPGNNGPDTPVDWSPYAGLDQAIRRNGGMLSIHEYFYKSGPQDGWRWWAGRHLQCPFDVPILLGEIGIDNYVDEARWKNEGGNRGWVGNVSPDQYAEMIEYHLRNSDTRVVAGLIFITDYRNNTWNSFDTSAAHNALLARKDRMVPQTKPATATKPPVDTHLPSVIAPGPQEPQEANVPALTHPIADPALRVVSQVFGVNPDRYARFGMAGHNGVDFAVKTGTPIGAAAMGQVVESQLDADGYGEYVKIRHAWGESIYAHLKTRKVEAGDHINAGQVVGLSGNTGNSTGPHLHFGMRVNPYQRGWPFDGYTDPLPYLDGKAQPVDDAQYILDAIKAAAADVDIEWQLLASLAWAESSWNPRAVSSAGAQGVMQLMPETFAEWASKINFSSDPFDAVENIEVGAAYMRWLLQQTKGNVYDALHAYVWGIGNVLARRVPPDEVIAYGAKIIHGRDLLKATGT